MYIKRYIVSKLFYHTNSTNLTYFFLNIQILTVTIFTSLLERMLFNTQIFTALHSIIKCGLVYLYYICR